MYRYFLRKNGSPFFLGMRSRHAFPFKVACLLIATLVGCLNVTAQQVRIHGTVREAGGQGLPGVTVRLKSSGTGTTTDGAGRFQLSLPVGGGELEFRLMGYEPYEARITGEQELNIVLQEKASELEGVVVVGYGKQSRSTVTTAISKLDNKVLENISYANVGTAMQGALAGVKVQTTSGQPGTAPRIIVRGGTSINNPNGAAPLYIVDGVIRTINNISPDDVESIQVLKDAASTAIYGARGSNGVVLITTKSGKAGKTQVTYSGDVTTSRVVRLFELASAEQYITLGRLGTVAVAAKLPTYLGRLSQPLGYGTGNDFTKNTDYTTMYLTDANRHKLNEGWQSMPDPIDPSKTIIYKETDFQALAMQTGISSSHHLSVSGGTEKATFNAGVGYLDASGTAKTTFYKRLTFNMNGDLYATNKLKFFARTMFAQAVDNRLVSDSYTFWGAATRPTAKYTYEDGTLAPGRINQGNPDYHMKNRDAENRSYNLTLTAGARWDILDGLSFEPQVSYNSTFGFNRSFQPAYGNGSGRIVSTRAASANDSRNDQIQADAVLTYVKAIRDHNLDVKAGLSYFKRSAYSVAAAGQGASTDLIPTLNAVGQFVSMSSTLSDQVILGYFSRINYDYKQKYLLSVNMRYDGASNLGEQNKWGYFPGISVGWNMHNENFWVSVPKMLSTLKLRASYGVNGNISQLGDFTAQGTYSVGGQYAGGPVIQNTGIPNPDLRWERSKTVNAGADIGLLNNRLQIMFDAYRRVTDDLITTLTLPGSTGFTGILTNYGSLENRGIELEATVQPLAPTSRFSWTLSFNAAKTIATILSLPENGIERNRVGGSYVWDAPSRSYMWKGGLQEGGRIGDYYMYKQLGVYATDEQAAHAPVDRVSPTADKTKHGGDVIWLDADGNGEIDSRDMVYVGNMYPVWTGGISNYLQFENFTLALRLDYTTGHTIYNYGRAFYDINLDGDNVMTKRFADLSWKKQGDVTNVPRYYWQDATEYNIRRGNSEYYESGDYLAIREVTLAYSLPQHMLSKLKLTNVRLHFTGNNLHYFTKYMGLNPEDGGQEFGRYPIPRNFIFGINITL